MQRPVLAHISALAAALVVIVLVSALWIVNLRMGPRLDAFAAGPIVVFLPTVLLFITVVWVVLRAIFGRGRKLAAWTAVVGGAVLGLIVVVGSCGPTACLAGNERFMGWFAIGGAGLAALAHHLVLARFGGEAVDAQSI